MELYERIRYLAEKKEVSFAKLARELGIPHQTFHQWLKPGSQRNIWEHLPKIIKLFPDVRPAWLYMGELPVFRQDMPGQPPPLEGEGTSDRTETGSAPIPTEMRGKLRLHPGYHYDPLGRIEMLTNVRGSSAAELQAVFGVDLKELKPFVARYYNARQAWDAWRAAGSREEDVPDVELPQIPEDWLDYFWRHYGPSPQWVLYGGGENSWSALVRPHLDMPETERLRDELAAVKKEARQRQDEADRLRQELLTDAREKNVRLEVHKEEVQRLRDEADRLQQALADAREKNARLEVHEEEAQRLRGEADRLRQALADVREKNARLEVHEEEAQRLRDEADRLRQALADVREKNARLEATLEERTPPDKNKGNRAPSPPAANSMRPGKK